MEIDRTAHEDTGWPQETREFAQGEYVQEPPAPDPLQVKIAEAQAAAARVAQAARDAEAAASLKGLQEEASRRRAEQLAAQRAEFESATAQARAAIAAAKINYPAVAKEIGEHMMGVKRGYAHVAAVQAPTRAAWARYMAAGGTRAGWAAMGGTSDEMYLMEIPLAGDFSQQEISDHQQELARLGCDNRNSY